MRILHTSDLHLGKRIEGKDRLGEQRKVLEEICGIAEEKSADLALICGDVYDSYIPPAEAEDLFYEFVEALSCCGKRLVVAIAGNHDDPVRLCAASCLAQKQAIIISGGGDERFKIPQSPDIRLLEQGKNYIKVEIGGERATIAFLSYPSDARLGEVADERGYSEKISGYLGEASASFSPDSVNVVMAHLFAAGAAPIGEEREIEAGGLKACSLNVFSDKCHYVALGHIHRCQRLKDNAFYSGSILQYSAGEESSKCVLLAEAYSDGLKKVEKIPLLSGKKIITYAAEGVMPALNFLESGLEDYVYLKIRQDRPLLYDESRLLRSFDNVLEIELETELSQCGQERASRKGLSRRELFCEFYRHRYGGEPEPELVNLFLEITESET